MNGGARRLRELLAEPKPVVAPGAYDALTAKVIERLGFQCTYLGGFAAAAQLGTAEPLLSLTEQAESCRLVTKAVEIPLITDGHAGFGDPIHVGRMIREFEAANIAGTHIEDAIFPKRVHYFQGVIRMVPVEEMVTKLRYAKQAQSSKDFVVIARTESRYARDGGGLDEVLRRLHAYAKAGADALMPFVWDPEEATVVANEFRGIPLLWIGRARNGPPAPSKERLPWDKYPELTIEEAFSMGYKIIVYPAVALATATQSVAKLFGTLMKNRRTEVVTPELMPTWELIDNLVGLTDYTKIEAETTERVK